MLIVSQVTISITIDNIIRAQRVYPFLIIKNYNISIKTESERIFKLNTVLEA